MVSERTYRFHHSERFSASASETSKLMGEAHELKRDGTREAGQQCSCGSENSPC